MLISKNRQVDGPSSMQILTTNHVLFMNANKSEIKERIEIHKISVWNKSGIE